MYYLLASRKAPLTISGEASIHMKSEDGIFEKMELLQASLRDHLFIHNKFSCVVLKL